jgi:DNA-binding PucR family transcriptional regulator
VTAKALHVHPNTVAYRLRRVEELLEIDLGDPQAMLHLQLAFMIESILGD